MGLLGTMGRTAVIAGTAQAVAGGVAQRQQQAASPGPPPISDQTVEQLKKLAELRNVGALTEAEFAAQKARLLPS